MDFLRLEETLPKPKRIGLSATHFSAGFKEVVGNKISMGYTLCMGCIFGSLIGYLNSAQQIFQELYATGHLFTLYFGLLALILAARPGQCLPGGAFGYAPVMRSCPALHGSHGGDFLAVEQWLSPPLWMFMLFAGINFYVSALFLAIAMRLPWSLWGILPVWHRRL